MRSYFLPRIGKVVRNMYGLLPKSNRLPSLRNSEFCLAYFSGSRGISFLNASLRSVSKTWKSIPNVKIFSDGTKSEILKNSVIEWGGKLEIIGWEECAAYFESKGNVDLSNYAKGHLWGKKLICILYAFEHQKTLYSDTDVLWFKDPSEILPLETHSPTIKMSKDIEYCLSTPMIDFLGLKPDEITPLNAGVIYGHGDFSTHPQWLDICSYLAKHPDNRSEQTALALLTSHFGSAWNMDQIYIETSDMYSIRRKNPSTYKQIYARHYVNTKNWLFWKDYLWFKLMKYSW